jgi:uncharacterized protein (TIGR00159 family)
MNLIKFLAPPDLSSFSGAHHSYNCLMTWHWQNAIDFCALVGALYLLLRWSRDARALRLALAIVGIRLGAFAAGQLDLPVTSSLLDIAAIVGLIALVLIFQPELRRALMRFDIAGRVKSSARESVWIAVSRAAWRLADARCGALIVIERENAIGELVSPGVPLHAAVSADLLVAIFQKNSPLHDGAAILDGDIVAQAGAILPLTQRSIVPDEYGTRHRAAMGLADRSDAVVVVVSEERGTVTLISAGAIRAMRNEAELVDSLTAMAGDRSPEVRRRVLGPANLRLLAVSIALAGAAWAVAFLLPGRSVRVDTIPLEFTDVPPGLSIAAQSVDTVQVWLRGSEFAFETAGLQDIVARCDLGSAHAGMNEIPLAGAILDVPLGLRVDRVAPKQVGVELIADAGAQPAR